jgi:transcriptional regulator with XRE-family HTH domain
MSLVIVGVEPPPSRRDELSSFLRRHRDARSPESVGLTSEGRRRTPGLRREEVALLAGVGLSWYTWLEQGRDIAPSADVLDAIARVLGLDPADRTRLYYLAGVALPTIDGDYPREASQDLLNIVAGLDPNPAYLLGPRADVLAWNAGARCVLGDPTCAPDGQRNLLWWLFTSPAPAARSWEETGRFALARVRVEHARRFEHPDFASLVVELLDASERFRELWPRQESSISQVGTKRIEHPELGPLRLHHLQSIPTSDPDLRLTQLVPADDDTRKALDRVHP